MKIGFLLITLLVMAVTADATTGGPSSLEVLGWNPSTERIFFLSSNPEERLVGYFDLRSNEPSRVKWMKWPVLGYEEETERLRRFRRWLRPLEVVNPTLLPLTEPEVVQVDTLKWMEEYSHPRNWVQAQFDHASPSFEVAVFGSLHQVVRVRVHYLRERSVRIEVLAFKGDFQGYEIEAPILVRDGEEGIRRVLFLPSAGGESPYP